MNDGDQVIAMIRAGGVFYNVSGGKPEEVFADAVSQVTLPPGVDREVLLTGLCEREKLMTTSIGHGIAIPHPRTPMVADEGHERIYVCYLDRAISFDAMDGKPVYVLFLILASNPQSHLKVLSRLSWLLQQESFRDSLRKKPDTDELIGIIKQYYA